MRITSKEFWSSVACKLIETFISVKIWVLAIIIYFVHRLYCVADELRQFMMMSITETQKLQVLSSLQGKIYDISTSLLISGIVVIVLSRVTFQYAKLKNEYQCLDDNSNENNIKNNFA